MVRSEVILKDKVALITGGTRGIGAAIAKELYDLGATIIITGTQPDFKYTHNYQYICANFLKKKSLNELVNKIRKQKIDILVNNAGINRIGPISELSVNDFEKVQQVNVTAPFMLCQTVLLGMSERGWGRVVMEEKDNNRDNK